MRYSLVNERDVSASLELKLDPAIARSFGKDATKVVTDAEGMLVDQQISGVDVGTSIERANRGRAELQDELERVNRELRAARPVERRARPPAVRGSLDPRADPCARRAEEGRRGIAREDSDGLLLRLGQGDSRASTSRSR